MLTELETATSVARCYLTVSIQLGQCTIAAPVGIGAPHHGTEGCGLFTFGIFNVFIPANRRSMLSGVFS